jgi:hypothetical protein
LRRSDEQIPVFRKRDFKGKAMPSKKGRGFDAAAFPTYPIP